MPSGAIVAADAKSSETNPLDHRGLAGVGIGDDQYLLRQDYRHLARAAVTDEQ